MYIMAFFPQILQSVFPKSGAVLSRDSYQLHTFILINYFYLTFRYGPVLFIDLIMSSLAPPLPLLEPNSA